MTTWNKGLLPVGILFIIMGVIGILFRFGIGEIESSAGEILFWMWPIYFVVVGAVLIALNIVVGKKDANLLGMKFTQTSEIVSTVISIAFGGGFFLAMFVIFITRSMDLPEATLASKIWSGIGIGTGVIAGGVAAPTLAGVVLSKLGLPRMFINMLQFLLFIAGIGLAFVFWRQGMLDGWPLMLTMVTGALIATPVGIVVYRLITPKVVRVAPAEGA